jgi:predicted nucleotidyltransferase
VNALQAFGAPMRDIEARDFETPGPGFMMGSPPRRIDLLTMIDGVRFEEVAARAIEVSFDGVPTKVIGLEDLLTNKRASGRLQDLADARALERVRNLG